MKILIIRSRLACVLFVFVLSFVHTRQSLSFSLSSVLVSSLDAGNAGVLASEHVAERGWYYLPPCAKNEQRNYLLDGSVFFVLASFRLHALLG
jgi:hypothetical protein